MAVSEDVKKAVLKELRRRQPLMDTARMKELILSWLEQFKFPGCCGKSGWDKCIKEYKPQPDEDIKMSGRRLRLTVQLCTAVNYYLISVIESLSPDSRGNYILAVHVNWKEEEKERHRMLEESYKGNFEDNLKARHVVWAQTFEEKTVQEALNACAVAMFGNELAPKISGKMVGTPIKNPHPRDIDILDEK